jgi:serine/threonine protein phosphatase PrpC
VWKDSDEPGLAMTRSIGDTCGKDIGIISTPIVQHFPRDVEKDQFLIMASDGVWDVMTNEEAVEFVEGSRSRGTGTHVTIREGKRATKMTVSQLLCEEARVKWFKVIEEEDVCFDDISAVIIELGHTKSMSMLHETADTDAPVALGLPEDFEEHNVVAGPDINPIHSTLAVGNVRSNSVVAKHVEPAAEIPENPDLS